MTPAPSSPAPPERADRFLPAPPFPPPRRRRGVRATGSRLWHRSWPWLLALVAVVVVVVTELGLVQDRIQADLARLRDAAGAPVTTTADAAPPLPAIPPVAPPAAGDVAAVRLRSLEPPCAPGTTCTVVVGVDHRAGTAATTTPWTVLAVDRCRGTAVPLAEGATPGAAGAYGVATVAVPPGRALAVLVVTAAPSRAASAALPVGAGPC